jgi:hypothetical protein
MKFGTERDEGFQKIITAQRARSNAYGTGSLRKQTQAKILDLARKRREQEKLNATL